MVKHCALGLLHKQIYGNWYDANYLPKNSMKSIFILSSVIIIAAACVWQPGQAYAKSGKDQKMSQELKSVQNLLGQIRPAAPFTLSSIADIFNTRLSEKNRNQYFAFFEADNSVSDGGLKIEKVDFRVRIDGDPHPGFLVVRIGDACVKKSDVLNFYDKLTISEIPRGRSLNEETHYSLNDEWGKVSFGFAEKNPDCLSSIVFDPKQEK
jgi:hypothetical protein